MNLRQIRYFVAIAEELNIGRAAKRLHVSQPPLTRQMQQLEAEIGTALLIRTRRGVELTSAGQVLLGEARNILDMSELAKERTLLAGQGRLGRLDIGVFGANALATPELLRNFRRSHPLVDVVVHAMNKEDQVEALREQRIAAAFNLLGSKLADIESEVVKVEPLMIAMTSADPLARQDRLRLSALAGRPIILFASGPRPNLVDVVFALCRDEGFQPRIAQEVVDSVTAISLVAAGFGICLVPYSATHLKVPGVVYRKLIRSPPATIELHCIYRRGDRSPILEAFLATLRATRKGARAARRSPST